MFHPGRLSIRTFKCSGLVGSDVWNVTSWSVKTRKKSRQRPLTSRSCTRPMRSTRPLKFRGAFGFLSWGRVWGKRHGYGPRSAVMR